MVTINRRLNLVIPVEQSSGMLYVHSSPIAPDVFEKYYLVISKTFSEIYAQGLNVWAGPRVASLILKDVADKLGTKDDVEKGLLSEIRRLTNCCVQKESGGWDIVPYQTLFQNKQIDAKDLSEVENALVFFTVASSMHRKNQVPAILDGVAELWEAQVTSSNCTEFASSLPISTKADATGTQTTSLASVPH